MPAHRAPLDSTIVSAFRWRSIGPANMGGRIADIAGIPEPVEDVLRRGRRRRHLEDHQRRHDLPSRLRQRARDLDGRRSPSRRRDTNIVWAGTGEQNSRNSISPGGGIYKSTDGGMTWKLMGLEQTQQIGRIVVAPDATRTSSTSPRSATRGSRTRSAGSTRPPTAAQTWQLIKFVSDKAGFVDVALDPNEPERAVGVELGARARTVLPQERRPGLRSLEEHRRRRRRGRKSKGGGFPETTKGRISIAISRSNPQDRCTPWSRRTPCIERRRRATSRSSGAGSGSSGLYRSTMAARRGSSMNDNDVRPFYYSQVRVDPKNPDRVYWSVDAGHCLR